MLETGLLLTTQRPSNAVSQLCVCVCVCVCVTISLSLFIWKFYPMTPQTT